MKPIKERFDALWMPEPFSGCWLWIGTANGPARFRYGNFRRSRILGTIRAHRMAWILYKGDIPNGIQVLHRCDTPMCVNPEHLFLGNAQINVADRDAKNRRADNKGERNGYAKLTDHAVCQIRASGDSQRRLATSFGVSRKAIYLIQKRQTWNHLS